MTTVTPGIAACHAYITRECLRQRGFEGAIDEALARIKREYIACRASIDTGSTPHIVLTIDHSTQPGSE